MDSQPYFGRQMDLCYQGCSSDPLSLAPYHRRQWTYRQNAMTRQCITGVRFPVFVACADTGSYIAACTDPIIVPGDIDAKPFPEFESPW